MKKVIRLTESDLTRIVKRVIEESAPERNVVDSKTGKMVGTHKYGVGFVPNELGRKMGHKEHPESIPNFTKFEDEDGEYKPMKRAPRLADSEKHIMRPRRGGFDIDDMDDDDDMI